MILLHAALEAQGINVDTALAWDVAHSLPNIFDRSLHHMAEFNAWADQAIAEYRAKNTVYMVSATPTASVRVIPGNTNELTVNVTELYSNGTVEIITVTITIRNNAEGIYQVGPYRVFVDTKGNDQIRQIYIIS